MDRKSSRPSWGLSVRVRVVCISTRHISQSCNRRNQKKEKKINHKGSKEKTNEGWKKGRKQELNKRKGKKVVRKGGKRVKINWNSSNKVKKKMKEKGKKCYKSSIDSSLMRSGDREKKWSQQRTWQLTIKQYAPKNKKNKISICRIEVKWNVL